MSKTFATVLAASAGAEGGGGAARAGLLWVVSAMMAVATAALVTGPVALAGGGAKQAEHYHWSFAGPFGSYDPVAMQRGYQVYMEVCASCHSMDLVAFRHLGEKGAPFYNESYPDPIKNPYIALLAEQYGEGVRMVPAVDDGGLPTERTPTPADYFPNPYANPLQAAAVNGGAVPPDFSTIVKARHHGSDYLRSLLIGYTYDIPEGLEVPPGSHYNPYFPGDVSGNWSGDPSKVPYGGFLAMAAPITADTLFTYNDTVMEAAITARLADNPNAKVEQMATDVAHFLTWVSHPHMEARKSLGRIVIVYLVLLAILLWFSYRQVWRNVEH